MKQLPWKAWKQRWLWPGLALGGVIALGGAVALSPALTRWDQSLLLALHRYATPGMDRFVLGFTDLGTVWGVLPGTVLLGVVLLQRRQPRQSAFLVLSVLGALVLNLLLKGLWQRARPNLWEGIPLYPDPSFPSGHATFSAAFVLAVVLLSQTSPHHRWPHHRWLGGLGGLLALLIGLSRSYLGVHYPSDVVGGWLLAVGWTVGLYQAMFSDFTPPSPSEEPPPH
ncbi:phosphatase PAP2 family protein [Leptolyngbya sp. BL0902]|uniref:phosphatase PAP2 family protein n=1 Tax=Leptolyngbya sp. BL0902 TaxID=1115757 RepID=UPI0018E89448|nr:phosphatase PAP2 family protein [Leptolyngbya sp. BL0902]QQE64188.1 phosphatase PAP2 family protein [Leptolyngbya sp. BL0902]